MGLLRQSRLDRVIWADYIHLCMYVATDRLSIDREVLGNMDVHT